MSDSTRSTYSDSEAFTPSTADSPGPTAKPEAEVSLRLLIAPFAKAEDARAWTQFVTTMALFVLGWAATTVSVVQGWGVLATLLFAIPTAGFTVRLFISGLQGPVYGPSGGQNAWKPDLAGSW